MATMFFNLEAVLGCLDDFVRLGVLPRSMRPLRNDQLEPEGYCRGAILLSGSSEDVVEIVVEEKESVLLDAIRECLSALVAGH